MLTTYFLGMYDAELLLIPFYILVAPKSGHTEISLWYEMDFACWRDDSVAFQNAITIARSRLDAVHVSKARCRPAHKIGQRWFNNIENNLANTVVLRYV